MIHAPLTLQTIDPGTVDLVAQEGRENALFANRLYLCTRKGCQVVSESGVLVATISRLGSPSRHRDHPHGEGAIEGVSKEATGIPSASTPH